MENVLLKNIFVILISILFLTLTAANPIENRVSSELNSVTQAYDLQADTTPPTVLSCVPTDGQTLSSILSQIEFIFSESMNRTATESSLAITPEVTGNISWYDTDTRMTFEPYANLSLNTSYSIKLDSSKAQDLSGNLLDGNGNGVHDSKNSWSARADMPTVRSSLSAVLLNNRIYTIGGRDEYSVPTNLVEIYDPTNNSWSTGTPMPTPRSGFGAGVVNNRISAVGGYNATTGTYYNRVEEYDPATDQWTQKTPISVARRGLSVCAVNNRLFAIGGQRQDGVSVTLVEEYDPVNNTWTPRNPMLYSTYYAGCAAASGKIYVIAGSTTRTQEYNPDTNTWAVRQTPLRTRVGLGAASVNGTVYAIGGGDSGEYALSNNDAYNPISNSWSVKANMPTARWDLSVISYKESVYAIGGGDIWGKLPANEMYIVTDDFTSAFRTSVVSDTSYNIPVTNGWNLISLPLVQSDSAVETILSSIAGQWDVVKYYDATDSADPWKSYRINGSANDFWNIDHTVGFWLHATQNSTLSVSGQPPTGTNILLSAGWNLVGYPTLNETMTVALAFQGTDADRVEKFDPASPFLISEVLSSYIMKPGEGYWVHVPADTIWNVNW